MASKYQKPAPVVRVPFKPSYPPSAEQEVIFDALKNTKDNLHLEASPGSGKSTTLCWSMTIDKTRSSAMVAFGKDICTDIEPKCAPHVTVATFHSFGRRALASEFGNDLLLSNDMVKNLIIKEYPYLDPFTAKEEDRGPAFSRMSSLLDLIDKLRVNLADETNAEEVTSIADQYNIDLDGSLIELLPNIFEKMIENPKVIDFTSMIWLPVRMGLPNRKYDMIYMDERQDANRMMIELIRQMSGSRIITVGDSNQAIMNFAGADAKSTERLIESFPGQELGLNTCYRCGTDIVALAATIWDKIKPYEKNHKGVIEYRDKIDMTMPEGSMIISRRNANLIKPCFELLKSGRKAIIRGRDIGSGLILLINKLKAKGIVDLEYKIERYRQDRIEKIMSRKDVKTESIGVVNDQCDCIIAIAENCHDVADVKKKIDTIFAADTKGITLSSIHRSKGREAKMVTILDYSRVRLMHDRMTPTDVIQEKNLQFVALTRAMDTLHLIN